VLLALGSNLGDRLEHLQRAVQGVARVADVRAVSAVYETDPVGYTAQQPFFNAAVRCDTRLGLQRLFVWCKGLEFAAGRRPGVPQGPRPLDIDIIAYGALAAHSDRLDIPHPRFAERAFMLAPLADVAPDTVIPGQTEPVRALDRSVGRAGVRRAADADALWHAG
jgi:2-amino-4-hydroxy-6-hydroxymethyldihydropteridine diphosphokinase